MCDLPIPVNFDLCHGVAWPTSLVLRAVATGDDYSKGAAIELFGDAVASEKQWTDARDYWRYDPDGFRVALHPASNADILFDPWDDANTRSHDGVPLVFKRSPTPTPYANTVVYPAWPRKETLGLNFGLVERTECPVVSFCGVANRPECRAAMIEAFRDTSAVDFRLTTRAKFAHPGTGAFLGMIRESHFVLCPPGVGRFSYRLYETLAAGRIPVVPKGQHAIPPEIANRVVISYATTPEELRSEWDSDLRKRWATAHIQNKYVWMDYASPLGALKWMALEGAKRL